LLNVLLFGLPLLFAGSADAHDSTNRPTVLLVVGAAGEEEFATNFVRQAQLWERVCDRAVAKVVKIGLDEQAQPSGRDRLKQALEAEAKDGAEALWIVLVGHGTFDGKEGRFNLRGPDFTATELAEWVKPFHRPLVVINNASASAPFLNKLSATNRVVITSTRSGNEQNYARLGSYLAEAIGNAQSDLDKDGQVSLLETFVTATSRVAEFYKTEGRLATEHALIDDNGDGLGTPADWFRGVRAVKKAQTPGRRGRGADPQAARIVHVDGDRAHQVHLVLSPEEQSIPTDLRAKRDALELSIFQLRENKARYSEDDYYRELEKLLLEMAKLIEPQLAPTLGPTATTNAVPPAK
jgi:hypothetical protein